MEAPVLRYMMDNGIDCLYHITSIKNWQSIRGKGICSLSLLEEQGLSPFECGSDFLDRERRRKSGLDHYVSLSLSSRPPFFVHAQKAGLLKDCIIIKVSPEVLLAPETLVYDSNPQDDEARKGTTLSFVESLRLDLAREGRIAQGNTVCENRYSSAEVLVKGSIPLEFILNREELDSIQPDKQQASQQLYLFVLDLSETMSTPITFDRIQYETCSELSIHMLNESISRIVDAESPTTVVAEGKGAIENEIGVIGYGNGNIPSWNDDTEGQLFKKARDLFIQRENDFHIDTEKVWLEFKPDSDIKSTLEDALIQAKQIVSKWFFSHPGSVVYVFHITNGRSVRRLAKRVEKAAADLSSLTSLYFSNLQLSSHTDQEILYVGSQQKDFLDPYGTCLYSISSNMPSSIAEDNRRAFSVNVRLKTLIEPFLKKVD